jgi:hypothetical protein
MLDLFTRDVTRDWVHIKFQSEPHREARKNTQRIQIVKLPRGLSVRLERFQVMAIVWEQHKMLPAELR